MSRQKKTKSSALDMASGSDLSDYDIGSDGDLDLSDEDDDLDEDDVSLGSRGSNDDEERKFGSDDEDDLDEGSD